MLTPVEDAAYELITVSHEVVIALETLKSYDPISGIESLYSNTLQGLQSFVAWLKKKIQEWVQKFIQFVKVLKRVILNWFVRKNNQFLHAITSTTSLNSKWDRVPLTIPYDLSKILHTLDVITGHLPFKMDGHNTTQLNTSMLELSNMWKRCIDEKNSLTLTCSKCCMLCRQVVDRLRHLEAIADTISRNMSKLQSSIDNIASPTDLSFVILYLVSGAKGLVKADHTTITSKGQSCRSLEEFQQFAKATIEVVMNTTIFITNLLTPTTQMISVIDKIYNGTSYDLHYETTIDLDFLHHIESMLHGSLCVGKIIVTTRAPNTWPTISDNGVAGWCYAGTGLTGVKDLWINARYLLEDTEEDHLDPAIHRLLSTIVHECVHLWDSQNGGEISEQRGRDAIHERKAYAIEASYKPTLRETFWAKHQLQTMLYLKK